MERDGEAEEEPVGQGLVQKPEAADAAVAALANFALDRIAVPRPWLALHRKERSRPAAG